MLDSNQKLLQMNRQWVQIQQTLQQQLTMKHSLGAMISDVDTGTASESLPIPDIDPASSSLWALDWLGRTLGVKLLSIQPELIKIPEVPAPKLSEFSPIGFIASEYYEDLLFRWTNSPVMFDSSIPINNPLRGLKWYILRGVTTDCLFMLLSPIQMTYKRRLEYPNQYLEYTIIIPRNMYRILAPR